MGRDLERAIDVNTNAQFQSTRPAWGATWHSALQVSYQAFQSTRPAWGATDEMVSWEQGVFISIHAPRMGRDHVVPIILLPPFDFNPRAPHGARLGLPVNTPMTQGKFQSTRPAWGATKPPRPGRRDMSISIHAPRMGRDTNRTKKSAPRRYFNPRAPHGARHLMMVPRCTRLIFQSTRPAWGATVDVPRAAR